MTQTLDRRAFLASSSAAFVAGGLSLAGGPSARGIEPIERSGPPHFLFSLAAYSYRSQLTAKGDEEPKLTMFDFVTDCAKMDLEGTELTSYFFPEKVGGDYIYRLKRHCFLEGLDVSGTAIRNDFGFPDEESRRREIDWTRQWIEYAEMLGAPVIRIFAGQQKKDVSPQETHRLMVQGFEECSRYAGEHGVHLALENHGGPTATPEGLLALVKQVSSPWFGVNLDTGNFHSDDPYADIAQAAPYAVNVQVKVVMQRGGKKEPADFSRLAGILRDAGYRGYVVLEYEESGDPREECPKYVDQLRAAFDKVG